MKNTKYSTSIRSLGIASMGLAATMTLHAGTILMDLTIDTALIGNASNLAGDNLVNIANQGPALEVTDGTVAPVGAFVIDGGPSPQGNGADTWAGAGTGTQLTNEFDFVGVEFDITGPINDITCVKIQQFVANDGGWWGPTAIVSGGVALTAADLAAPTLQVLRAGVWSDVATTNDYVTTYTGVVRGTGFPDATAGELATFNFAEQDSVEGIRLIGNAAGNAGADANGFISAIEFQVFQTVVPEPTSSVFLVMGGIALLLRRKK